MSILRLNEPSLIERIVLKLLSKLTFTNNGLRTEAVISSGTVTTVSTVTTVTTCATVTNVSAVNASAIGRISADNTGIYFTNLVYQSGFRRNLVIT